MQELLPYVDYPPSNSESTTNGLKIISHFNGKPISNNYFQFPELVSETENGLPSTSKSILFENDPDVTGLSLFYIAKSHDYNQLQQPRTSFIPKYLRERKYVLTKLQPK